MFSISEELNKKVDNDISCWFFSLSLHNKKLRSLIRQLSATMNYCLNLLTIELTINCHLFFLFLHRKKGLPLYAAFKRDWSIVWILCYESILSLVIHFPYSTQRESGRHGMVHLNFRYIWGYPLHSLSGRLTKVRLSTKKF